MNKIKILLIIVGIFLVQTISALIVDIQIPPSFSTGDQTYFSYTITSVVSQEITFIPYIICPNAPIAYLREKIINLDVNIPHDGIYNDITVTENIEPQTCTAYVQILNPIQQVVSKNFSITTDPSFTFNIKLDKKIFTQNQDIYLDYSSSIENPSLTSTLTYPDKSTEQITLPTSIPASKIGTYTLDVTASKEGYKTISVKEQFGVIEKQAKIKVVEKPDLEEFRADEREKELKPVFIWLIVVVLIILIVFVIYFLIKRRGKVFSWRV